VVQYGAQDNAKCYLTCKLLVRQLTVVQPQLRHPWHTGTHTGTRSVKTIPIPGPPFPNHRQTPSNPHRFSRTYRTHTHIRVLSWRRSQYQYNTIYNKIYFSVICSGNNCACYVPTMLWRTVQYIQVLHIAPRNKMNGLIPSDRQTDRQTLPIRRFDVPNPLPFFFSFLPTRPAPAPARSDIPDSEIGRVK
jgi:hypothetical protein